jgi:hypothetical protein
MKYSFFKIISINSLERKLFFEAYFYSFYFSAKVLFQPFKKYSKILGTKNSIVPIETPIDQELLLTISRAIKRAAKYSLWRCKCLEQSLIAKKMLSKRDIESTIYFGVRKPDDKLEAHAWVKVGEAFVVGQKQHHTFTVVALYT